MDDLTLRARTDSSDDLYNTLFDATGSPNSDFDFEVQDLGKKIWTALLRLVRGHRGFEEYDPFQAQADYGASVKKMVEFFANIITDETTFHEYYRVQQLRLQGLARARARTADRTSKLKEVQRVQINNFKGGPDVCDNILDGIALSETIRSSVAKNKRTTTPYHNLDLIERLSVWSKENVKEIMKEQPALLIFGSSGKMVQVAESYQLWIQEYVLCHFRDLESIFLFIEPVEPAGADYHKLVSQRPVLRDWLNIFSTGVIGMSKELVVEYQEQFLKQHCYLNAANKNKIDMLLRDPNAVQEITIISKTSAIQDSIKFRKSRALSDIPGVRGSSISYVAGEVTPLTLSRDDIQFEHYGKLKSMADRLDLDKSSKGNASKAVDQFNKQAMYPPYKAGATARQGRLLMSQQDASWGEFPRFYLPSSLMVETGPAGRVANPVEFPEVQAMYSNYAKGEGTTNREFVKAKDKFSKNPNVANNDLEEAKRNNREYLRENYDARTADDKYRYVMCQDDKGGLKYFEMLDTTSHQQDGAIREKVKMKLDAEFPNMPPRQFQESVTREVKEHAAYSDRNCMFLAVMRGLYQAVDLGNDDDPIANNARQLVAQKLKDTSFMRVIKKYISNGKGSDTQDLTAREREMTSFELELFEQYFEDEKNDPNREEEYRSRSIANDFQSQAAEFVFVKQKARALSRLISESQAFGGTTELIALAHIFKLRICVLLNHEFPIDRMKFDGNCSFSCYDAAEKDRKRAQRIFVHCTDLVEGDPRRRGGRYNNVKHYSALVEVTREDVDAMRVKNETKDGHPRQSFVGGSGVGPMRANAPRIIGRTEENGIIDMMRERLVDRGQSMPQYYNDYVNFYREEIKRNPVYDKTKGRKRPAQGQGASGAGPSSSDAAGSSSSLR